MFRFAFFINESGGDGADMKQADLSSQCNGSNTSFTLPEEYQAGSLRVFDAAWVIPFVSERLKEGVSFAINFRVTRVIFA